MSLAIVHAPLTDEGEASGSLPIGGAAGRVATVAIGRARGAKDTSRLRQQTLERSGITLIAF